MPGAAKSPLASSAVHSFSRIGRTRSAYAVNPEYAHPVRLTLKFIQEHSDIIEHQVGARVTALVQNEQTHEIEDVVYEQNGIQKIAHARMGAIMCCGGYYDAMADGDIVDVWRPFGHCRPHVKNAPQDKPASPKHGQLPSMPPNPLALFHPEHLEELLLRTHARFGIDVLAVGLHGTAGNV